MFTSHKYVCRCLLTSCLHQKQTKAMTLQLYFESTAVSEQQCVTAVIKNQAQVVQRLDSIMNPINHKPVNRFIYQVDNAIHPINNWGWDHNHSQWKLKLGSSGFYKSTKLYTWLTRSEIFWPVQVEQESLLSFDGFFPPFSLAGIPPSDLQMTAYK